MGMELDRRLATIHHRSSGAPAPQGTSRIAAAIRHILAWATDKGNTLRGDPVALTTRRAGGSYVRLSLGLLVCTLSSVCPGEVIVDVDRAAFHARHDLIWESLPTYAATPYISPSSKLDSSAFLGNGSLGALVYREGPDRLAWDLGRSDLYDHQPGGGGWFGNNRLPVGWFLMTTKGHILSGTMRIRIFDAELQGTVTTSLGSIAFRSFIARNRDILVVETSCQGEESVSWSFRGDTAISSRPYSDAQPSYQLNPSGFQVPGASGASTWVQPLAAGGEYATSWSVAGSGNARTLLATTMYSRTGQSRDSASAQVASAAAIGTEKLRADHAEAWHGLFNRHFLSIPDTRMETYYWVQIYKLLCAARSGGAAINLQGPWSVSSAWPCYWWDMNMELLYYPMNPANLPEIGKTLTDLFDRNATQLKSNIRNCQDCAGLGTTSGDALYSITAAPADQLPWNLHNYYLQFRYSMDSSMLRDRLYPLLRSSMNTYLAYLNLESDGRYHMASSTSPDYEIPVQYRTGSSDRFMKDSNYKLALIRWECQTLLEMASRLGIADPLAPRWQGILDSLATFPTDTTGLMVGAGVPLSISHRHYSHLLAFYPLDLIRWDSTSHRSLIERSVRTWSSLNSDWHGYSYTGSAAMYARMFQGDSAFEKLRRYIVFGARVPFTPSTMYQEGNNPVMETPSSWARSLQEMILQSQGGLIRVFPAVPTSWKDLAFHTMRTEGAFLVSAIRKNSTTTLVQVQSLAGQPCRIRTDLPRPVLAVSSSGRNLSVKDSAGILSLDLRAGETVAIYSAGGPTSATITPVPYEQGSCNFFGGQFKGFVYSYDLSQTSVNAQNPRKDQNRNDFVAIHQVPRGLVMRTLWDGPHSIEILGLDGRLLVHWSGLGQHEYTLPSQGTSSLLVRYRFGQANFTSLIPMIR